MSKTSFIGFCILSTFLVIAIVAPFIAPYDPWKPGYRFLHPSLAHPLGTNDIGQDIFTDIFLLIPGLPLMIILAAYLSPSIRK